MTHNAKFIRQQLSKGIQAHKTGDDQTARLHFQRALREDTTNIPSLLWLTYVTTDFDKQLFLLKRVLQLDPGNERAKRGMQWVAQEMARAEKPAVEASLADQKLPLQASPVVVEATDEVEVTDVAGAVDVAGATHAGDKATAVVAPDALKKGIDAGDHTETVAQHARRRVPLLALISVLGCLLIGIGVWRLAFYDASTSLAALATSTSVTPAFAVAPSATSTPIPTATDTPLPTNTPTPSPTPTQILPTSTPAPPTPTSPPLAYQPQASDEKWIEVDLSDQQVIAWEGETPVMNFSASTGMRYTPTVQGQFRIYQKLLATRMIGPGYNLPGVPHTMYFYRGYALHGAYWHNNFGQPMSHGCVNLSLPDAEALFNWAEPMLPAGVTAINATGDNLGTLVVVHQ